MGGRIRCFVSSCWICSFCFRFVCLADTHERLLTPLKVHDVPSSDPSTWRWMLHFTWRHTSSDSVTDPVEIKRIWDQNGLKLAEPLRSAFLAAPESSTLWCDRVAQWPTVPWDNRQGRVTLAGDAAHPMTYRMSILTCKPPFHHAILNCEWNRSRPRA